MRPPYLAALIAIVAALLALTAPAAWAQAPQAPTATTAPAATAPAPATTAPAGTATTPAAADPESLPIPEGSSGPVSVGGDMGGTALRLLLGLVVVVGLILGVWHLMKRMQQNRYPAAAEASSDLIGVLATTPLGPNRALHVIRVADEVVLVGATDHAVQPIARLEPETAAIITRALGPDDGGPGTVARNRAYATSGGPTGLLERLRAMTTRS